MRSYVDERCCCCHIKVGVEILGGVGIVIYTLSLVSSLIEDSSTANLAGTIAGAVLGMLLYASLIVARRIGTHRWYLPFIIINATCIALGFCIFVMFLVLLLMGLAVGADTDLAPYLATTSPPINGTTIAPRKTTRHPKVPEFHLYLSSVVIYFLAGLLLSWCWQVYSQYIVSRAYRSSRQEHEKLQAIWQA